jgi:nitroreductase
MLDLLYSRRSIRKYTSQLIENDKIEKLIEAALLSPTSRNREAWEFVVVTDKVALSHLGVSKPGSASMISKAPLAIVVCGNPLDSDVWIEDCSIAAIIIQLTAHDMGLGSCWIQLRGRRYDEKMSSSDYIKKTLDLPDHLEIECIISIGYPDEIKDKRDKSVLSYNKIFRKA